MKKDVTVKMMSQPATIDELLNTFEAKKDHPTWYTAESIEDISPYVNESLGKLDNLAQDFANHIYAGMGDIQTGESKVNLTLMMPMCAKVDVEISADDDGHIQISTEASYCTLPVQVHGKKTTLTR